MALSSLPSNSRSGRAGKSIFPAGSLVPFFLVTALFFLWGIPNNVNDVLIRQFMKSFAISRLEAGLVQSAFYMGYFLLAMPAALLMRKRGYKAGFLTGLVLFGSGSLLFWPAAIAGRYGFFLFALFVIASGLAFLETASNPYIAQCGPAETSEQRLNFSQAFNPLGAIFGVLVGTRFIFSGVELTAGQVAAMQAAGTYAAYLHSEIMRVITPYVVLGILALIWAVFIARTHFPAIEGDTHTASDEGNWRELLGYRHFVMAIIAEFLYVGTQVGIWSYFISYVQQYVHQPERTAGYFLTGTLVAFGVGRFSSAWLMRFVAPNRLMGFYSVANLVLVAIGIFRPGWFGLWAIFLTSFFMSLMFPTIFALGLKDLGANSKIGGSLLVMSIVGGAVLTPLMGWISVVTQSVALAYAVPFAAFAFIAWFSFVGSRIVPGPSLRTSTRVE